MFHDLMVQKGKRVNTFGDIVEILRSDATMRCPLSELTTAVHLMLTVPVTSCTAERSFSGLRRLKTYLRSTMSQARLNHVAILNCHQELLDAVDIESAVTEFVAKCSVRRNTFATN